MFQLHDAFLGTSYALGELALSHVRLHGDARYPWIVLVPRVSLAREFEDLASGELDVLMEEILRAGRAVRAVALTQGRAVEKLNVGQLGNVTPQLHVHVVGRRSDDPAWPGPVWGHSAAVAYPPDALAMALEAGRAALGL